MAGALIVGTISFNAVLCFLNTRGIAIGKTHVMMSEMLLISVACDARDGPKASRDEPQNSVCGRNTRSKHGSTSPDCRREDIQSYFQRY